MKTHSIRVRMTEKERSDLDNLASGKVEQAL